MGAKLWSHEIVTLAVSLLGGESTFVDTEDAPIKANEIAPQGFTWRKYPEQINIWTITAFLWDAKKSKNGTYLSGSSKEGGMLTENGLSFARKRCR